MQEMQETWVWSLGWEDPLKESMATHSSILAWRIPWTEEPGRLQSMGSQRVRQNWSDWAQHRLMGVRSPLILQVLTAAYLLVNSGCWGGRWQWNSPGHCPGSQPSSTRQTTTNKKLQLSSLQRKIKPCRKAGAWSPEGTEVPWLPGWNQLRLCPGVLTRF